MDGLFARAFAWASSAASKIRLHGGNAQVAADPGANEAAGPKDPSSGNREWNLAALAFFRVA